MACTVQSCTHRIRNRRARCMAPCPAGPKQQQQPLTVPPPMPPRGTPAFGPGSGGCRSMPLKSKMGSRCAARSRET